MDERWPPAFRFVCRANNNKITLIITTSRTQAVAAGTGQSIPLQDYDTVTMEQAGTAEYAGTAIAAPGIYRVLGSGQPGGMPGAAALRPVSSSGADEYDVLRSRGYSICGQPSVGSHGPVERLNVAIEAVPGSDRRNSIVYSIPMAPHALYEVSDSSGRISDDTTV